MEKVPAVGVTLKVASFEVYPVFVAVTVRTHSVVPSKVRVELLLFHVQSPEVLTMAYSSAAGTETGADKEEAGVPTAADAGKAVHTREVKVPGFIVKE